MSAAYYQYQLHQLIQPFPSCSLVSADGALLASNDLSREILTTTRLVAFQIVKKYLNPKPLDLFVMNDPENGGYSLSKLIFVAAIDANLYLIWDETNNLIDFKIPPTPLYEKNVKNSFVWKALVENNENSAELASFFENEKMKVDVAARQSELVKNLALPKSQSHWLKATQEIFEQQFSNKAMGSFDGQFKTPTNQLLKLKYTAEEKQNIKLISLDFTNTGLGTTYHAASHVVESGLVQKLVQFYQVEKFLTQSILDKIKIILPPKSIASKAHPTGRYNQEIQTTCGQLCQHNLTQLNSQLRKSAVSFEIDSELCLELKAHGKNFNLQFQGKTILLPGFEQLIQDQFIKISRMQKTDHGFQLQFRILKTEVEHLKITTRLGGVKTDEVITVNDSALGSELVKLQTGDEVSLKWMY
ncbi:MAG: hypothetical protein H7061_14455 [Bdellovibrionaceae bacterium]|nr:hypothetical protein [Bdellovibrio sp.]